LTRRRSSFANLAGGSGMACCDSFDWPSGNRTMRTAHEWLREHFDEIEDGAVVDVAFILGERVEPKRSERETGRCDELRSRMQRYLHRHLPVRLCAERVGVE